jgi:GNAT superfamily N-acetyltransferase
MPTAEEDAIDTALVATPEEQDHAIAVARFAEWDEMDHPRDKQGQFTAGPGGAPGTTREVMTQAAIGIAKILPGSRVQVSTRKDGSTDIDIEGNKQDKDGRLVPKVLVNVNGAYAHLGVLALPEADQGKGTGRAIMRTLVDHFDQAGVTSVNLHAAMTMGGYVWPRLGFEAHGDTGFTLRHQVFEKLHYQKHYGNINDDPNGPKLSEREVRAVIQTMRQGTTGMATRLADLRVDGENTGKKIMMGRDFNATLSLTDPTARARLNRMLAP